MGRLRSRKPSKIVTISFILSMVGYGVSGYTAEVDGFLQAQFGSVERIVIEAIKKDFGAHQEISEVGEDTLTGTKTLQIQKVRVGEMELPADVSYIFGYKCKCLTQVIVSWQLPKNATFANRQKALEEITLVAKKIAERSWDGGEILTGRVSNKIKEGDMTNYFFFRGVALDKSAITVWGTPVLIAKKTSFSQKTAEMSTLTANIDQLQKLGVNYELNIKKPDLKRLSSETF